MKTFFLTGFVGKYLVDHAGQIGDGVKIAWIVASVVIISVCAYLLGSLNFAIIISGKQYKQDIRSFGSKNAGMTNMMRTYGKKAAGLTLLGDALKAMVSCLIGYAFIGQYGAYIAGLFCILGHVFPLYYHFKGGKGVVTAAITILMCNPFVFLILFTIFVLLVLFTKYISLGSVMCMLLYPIVLDRVERSRFLNDNPPPASPYILFAVLMTILIVFKHWENIKRLFHGKENKFSFKKSVKTEKDADTTADESADKNS